jgi:hypothetical protein
MRIENFAVETAANKRYGLPNSKSGGTKRLKERFTQMPLDVGLAANNAALPRKNNAVNLKLAGN